MSCQTADKLAGAAYEATDRLRATDRLIIEREVSRRVLTANVRMPTVLREALENPKYSTAFVDEAFLIGVTAGVGELRRRVRKALAVTGSQEDWAYAHRESNRVPVSNCKQ